MKRLIGMWMLVFAGACAPDPVSTSGQLSAMVATVVSPTLPAAPEVAVAKPAATAASVEARAWGAVEKLKAARTSSEKARCARRVAELASLCEKQGSGSAAALRAAVSQDLRAAALASVRRAEPDWDAAVELLDAGVALGAADGAQLKAALDRCELEVWARSRYKEAFAIVALGAAGTMAQANALLDDIPEDCDVACAVRVLKEQTVPLAALERAREALKRRDRRTAEKAAREALESPGLPRYAAAEARDILARVAPKAAEVKPTPSAAVMAAPGVTPPPLSPYATSRLRAEAFAKAIQ